MQIASLKKLLAEVMFPKHSSVMNKVIYFIDRNVDECYGFLISHIIKQMENYVGIDCANCHTFLGVYVDACLNC